MRELLRILSDARSDMLVTNITKSKKIALSAVIAALYIVIMYFTASFAFGAYQIRIATAMYALSYVFPFLVLPLALANMLSNILSGQVLDIIGGFIVGLITSGAICLLRRIKSRWASILIIPILILFPGFIVPIWLTFILGVPYWALVASLLVGQIIPALTGYLLVITLTQRLFNVKQYRPRKIKKNSDENVELSDTNAVSSITNIEYSANIDIIKNTRSFEDAQNEDSPDKEEIL